MPVCKAAVRNTSHRPGPGGGEHALRPEPPGGPGSAGPGPDHRDEGHGRGGLGNQSPQRRAGDPQPSSVDQREVEPDVDQVGGDHHVERGLRVLEPAQHTGAGEQDQDRRQPDGGDPQIGQRRPRSPAATPRTRRQPAPGVVRAAHRGRCRGSARARVRRTRRPSPPRDHPRPAGGRPCPWCRTRGRCRVRSGCRAGSRRSPGRPVGPCRDGRRSPNRRAAAAARRSAWPAPGAPAGRSPGRDGEPTRYGPSPVIHRSYPQCG